MKTEYKLYMYNVRGCCPVFAELYGNYRRVFPVLIENVV